VCIKNKNPAVKVDVRGILKNKIVNNWMAKGNIKKKKK
jgi:hypothetical protein